MKAITTNRGPPGDWLGPGAGTDTSRGGVGGRLRAPGLAAVRACRAHIEQRGTPLGNNVARSGT